MDKLETSWSDYMKQSPELFHAQRTRVKKLARQGIPKTVRAKVWMAISGASQEMERNPGQYQQFVLLSETDPDPASAEPIERDLPRTFPNSDAMRVPLRRVLNAYARRNPAVGYSKGMSFVAGTALRVLEEESAFWLLAHIIETILPQDYYTDLTGFHVDTRVLNHLVLQHLPKTSSKVQESGMEAGVLASEWLITLFTTGLAPDTVLRVWDTLLCEGDKVLFRVALAVLHAREPAVLAAADIGGVAEALRGPAALELDPAALLHHAFALPLTREGIRAARDRCRAELLRERAPSGQAGSIPRAAP